MNIEWGPKGGSKRMVPLALRGAGYDMAIASSGAEALQLVGVEPPFDLFVLDMMMPQMRGDELARRERAA